MKNDLIQFKVFSTFGLNQLNNLTNTSLRDVIRPNLDLVKEGKVYGLVAQPLYEEFFNCAELLVKVLNGEQIEYLNLLPAPIITAADLDAYYGFNDRAEASMNK